MLLRSPDAGGNGGGKAVREQKILLWVEAPAEKLKAPESGLNLAIRKLGAIDRLLRGIEAKYKRIASMTLPSIGGGGRGGGIGSAGASTSAASASITSSAQQAGKIVKEVLQSDMAGARLAAKEIVTSLNDAGTALLRKRIDNKGNAVFTRVENPQLAGAKQLTEALKQQGIELNKNIALATTRLTREQQLREEAVAYARYAREVRGLIQAQGVSDPAKSAALQKDASDKELRAKQRIAQADKERDKSRIDAEKSLAAEAARQQKMQDRSDDARARQIKDEEKSLAAERLRVRTKAEQDAEDAAKRAQTAAFNAAQKGTPAQNRVAGLQGRVAYLNSLKASGTLNPSQLLKLTNDLAVAQATLATATAAVNQQYSHVGKNMVQNVAHVTAWAAAVGTLYGSLRLLKFGADSVLELEYAMARLGQVFRHQEQVPKLVDGVLQLASANGRSSKEAMDSAIQWSRLNLNRVQVLEAVRVSLMGANVAELTAAQSTEHLASLYQVYGLRVSELNSVLGMLNQTSNTYNVTNKALLEGITRTSAAAKQAGIGLAELIGLIGAGVGSTGQTGPNIGNALKSFIGSISSPDKQKLLRDQFQFEVTVGGTDEVKSMSALLAELFVTFQRMSQAERQSMIFNVAGKNQASRLTAILDNYIRAQTLAINAQLNLNSAERENEAIRATAKARLQGLITEIERFANSAANFGKDATGLSALVGFSEVVLAMKNSLAAFNGGPGAMMLGLVAAIAAKSLVMMTVFGQTGKQGGVLANSMLGLAGAFKDVNAALLKGLTYHPKWIQNMAGIKVAADGAAVATKGLGKALAVAVAVAAVELAAVAAVVFTISKLINFGSEKLGFSSDSADKAMQDMTQKAEAAKGAADAAQTQIKLYETMQRALAANDSRSGRGKLIGEMMDGVPEGRRGALRERLDNINQEADAVKRNAEFKLALEAEVREAAARSATERVRQQRAEFDNVVALRREIERLENSAAGRRGWNKGDVQKKKDQLAEMQNSGVAKALADSEGQDDSALKFRQTNQGHLIFLEKQKTLLETIKDLYAQIPGESFLDQHRRMIYSQESSLAILQAEQAVLNERYSRMGGEAADSDSATASSITERIKKLRQLATAQFEARSIGRQLDRDQRGGPATSIEEQIGYDPFAEGGQERLEADLPRMADRDEMERLLEKVRLYNELLAQQAALEREVATVRSQAGMQALEAKRHALAEQIAQMETQMGGRPSEDFARQRDRNDMVRNVAAGFIQSSAVGSNESERLRNQLDYNRATIAAYQLQMDALNVRRQQAAQARELADIDRERNDLAIAMRANQEAAAKAEQQLLIRNKQLKDEERQAQKDFTKQMMFDSPGNILKRMAMDKLTKGGKDLRGFMGFDEAGRNMMRPLVENRMEQAVNDAEMKRRGVRPGLGGIKDLVENRRQEEPWIRRIESAITDGVTPMIREAAAAAINLTSMNSQLALAAGHTASFTAEVRAATVALSKLLNPNGPPDLSQGPRPRGPRPR